MNEHHPSASNERAYWLDQPDNVRLLVRILLLVCAALLMADLFVHRHTHFGFEEWFGFYAWYGFLCYCFIVLSAKQLRRLIARRDDYYDR